MLMHPSPEDTTPSFGGKPGLGRLELGRDVGLHNSSTLVNADDTMALSWRLNCFRLARFYSSPSNQRKPILQQDDW